MKITFSRQLHDDLGEQLEFDQVHEISVTPDSFSTYIHTYTEGLDNPSIPNSLRSYCV